jgi:hypothetical protein
MLHILLSLLSASESWRANIVGLTFQKASSIHLTPSHFHRQNWSPIHISYSSGFLFWLLDWQLRKSVCQIGDYFQLYYFRDRFLRQKNKKIILRPKIHCKYLKSKSKICLSTIKFYHLQVLFICSGFSTMYERLFIQQRVKSNKRTKGQTSAVNWVALWSPTLRRSVWSI